MNSCPSFESAWTESPAKNSKPETGYDSREITRQIGRPELTNTSMGLFQTGAITLEVFLHHSLGARAIKNRTGVAWW